MKKKTNVLLTVRLFGIIALAAVIGYGIVSCDDGSTTPPGGKSAGAAVTAPTLASKTANSITVNAVTAPTNGQTVEYGRNGTNAAPSTWQDGLTFSGLTAETRYYIFARSKANDSYNAGAASAGLEVTTDSSGGIVGDGTVSISGTAMVDFTLTAITAGLGGSGDISYEWKRNDGTVIGTNQNTLYLAENRIINSSE